MVFMEYFDESEVREIEIDDRNYPVLLNNTFASYPGLI